MGSVPWVQFHGAATHFPIAFIFGATLFEVLAFFRSARQREFQIVGYWSLILAGLGSIVGVFSGLLASEWNPCGKGLLLQHHLFVWPAFILIVGLTSWRFAVVDRPSRRASVIYLSLMLTACALIGAAGFSGGELLLGK
jgi:uncharacterized membrane protein